MSKPTKNPWTDSEIRTLEKFARGGQPLADIAARLGRTEADVRREAKKRGISLDPPPNSPYARK